MTRYKIIVKVKINTGRWIFRSFKTNNLLSAWRYLERNYVSVAYMNVYAYKFYRDRISVQLASFTKNNPPTSPYV